MRKAWQKLLRNYRDFGPVITLKKGARFLLRLLASRQTYRLYRVRLDRARPAAAAAGFPIRLLSPDEAGLIRQIEEMEEWLAGSVERRLRGGGICLVALEGDEVAGFNLVSFGEVFMPLVRYRKLFPADAAWSEQISVRRRHRGRGLATAIRLRAFEELRARGVRRFYGGTLPDNHANLMLCRKVGFESFADIVHSNLLFFHRWSVRRVTREPGA